MKSYQLILTRTVTESTYAYVEAVDERDAEIQAQELDLSKLSWERDDCYPKDVDVTNVEEIDP